MATFQTLFLIALTVVAVFGHPSQAAGIRDGFYKIQSVSDSTVLEATLEGRPRAVITNTWKNDEPNQEWKIKALPNSPLKMVRNEEIRDNEVSKQDQGPRSGGKIINLEPSEWKFTPAGNSGAFELDNGKGCLQNNGIGERITFEPCNPTSSAQQWKVSFLFEI